MNKLCLYKDLCHKMQTFFLLFLEENATQTVPVYCCRKWLGVLLGLTQHRNQPVVSLS